MACCGQRRQAWQRYRPPQPMPVPVPPPALGDPTKVRHRGESSVVVRGEHTGLTYLFGPSGTLTVDGQDVPALLATGLFDRA